MSEKLLPCPFCGEEPTYISDPSQVWCKGCCFQIEDENKEATINRWNTRPTPKPIEGDEVEDGDSVEAMDIRMEIVDIYANDELKSDNEELNSRWKQDCLKILIADRLAKAGYSKMRLRELDEEEVFRLVNTLKLFTVLTKDHPHVNTLTVHSGKILAKAICLKFGSQGMSLEVDRTLLTMTLVNVARQSSNEEEYAENLAKAIEDGTIFNVQVKK